MSKSPTARRQNRSLAFSLVEILVVVVILGILVALLFPVASRMVAKSRETACLSNLRTLGQASLNFFQDQDGRLFPSKFWYSPSWSSTPGIRDYAGIASTNLSTSAAEFQRDTVFTCKELKRQQTGKYPAYLHRSYSVNYFAHENDPETGAARANFPKRLAGIPSPSRMWLFTDGVHSSATNGSYSTYLRRADAVPDGTLHLFAPHAGCQNTVFFDGHVESLSTNDFYTPQSPRKFWGDLSAPD